MGERGVTKSYSALGATNEIAPGDDKAEDDRRENPVRPFWNVWLGRHLLGEELERSNLARKIPVTMEVRDALSDANEAKGNIQACQARAAEDLIIEA